jgi:hypothetical protein
MLAYSGATSLCACQGDPPAAKPAEQKPASTEAAPLKPLAPLPGGRGQEAGRLEPLPGAPAQPTTDTCQEASKPLVEAGLDESLPGITFEEALAADIGPHQWQRIRQINRWHKEIEKRVKLSDEQRAMLLQRFQKIYATIAAHPIRAGWGGFNYPKMPAEEREKLEMEVMQAEASGDQARSEEIRSRILQGAFGSEQNMAPAIEAVVFPLKDKLDPDQHEVFQYVFERWYAMEPRSPLDVPLRMLNRSLRDPDLKLTPEVQKKAQTIVEETSASLPPPPERRQKMVKATEEAKAKILAMLNPEQAAILENNYAQAEQERAAVERFTKDSYAKRGAKVSESKGKPATGGE